MFYNWTSSKVNNLKSKTKNWIEVLYFIFLHNNRHLRTVRDAYIRITPSFQVKEEFNH